MAGILVENPFTPILDLQGLGEDGGKVYIGVAGQNPRTNPQLVYDNPALTGTPLAQPLTTVAGYIYSSGAPVRPFCADPYSIAIDTPQDVQILYKAEIGVAPALAPDLSNVDATAEEGADFLDAIEANAANVLYDPDGAGAVRRSVQVKLRELPVSPEEFGAVGNGVADDTAAIVAAETFCRASGARVQAPASTYKVTSTIELRASGDWSAATFIADATALSPVIRVGKNTYVSTPDLTRKLTLRLPNVTNSAKSGTGWTGFATAIGVELANNIECEIYLEEIYGFGVGLRCGGYTQGFAYNKIFLKKFTNNKVQLHLKPGNDAGWCNENTFFGGRFQFDGTEGTNVSGTRDILLEEPSTGVDNFGPNNNVFVQPSVEGDTPEYHVWCHGSYNQFQGARWESASSAKFHFYSRVDGDCSSNMILGGYSPETIAFSFSGSGVSDYGGMVTARRTVLFGSAHVFSLSASASGGPDGAHLIGWQTDNPLDKALSATDWVYKLYAQGFSGKLAADTDPRLLMDFVNGRYYVGPGDDPPTRYIGENGGKIGFNGGDFIPVTDDAYALGGASNRFTEVWAVDGSINTSDAREKQWRGGLSAAELNVAKALSGLLGLYRWKSAVAKKDDAARLHIGVTVQSVIAAFEAEGLDAFAYGVACYDQWEEGGEQKDRYGIRYDELWAFVAAGFEARLAALES